MNTKQTNPKKQTPVYQMYPIGYVRRNGDKIHLEIEAAYRPALKELEHFSHVMVFWWADQLDSEEMRAIMQMEPPYAPGHVTGVFASRSPLRPNPVAMTTCKLLDVDEDAGTVTIADIDALDHTPVVDLKAYFPVCDRVHEATIPAWLSDWPDWMPENGIGLEEYER